MPFVFALLLLSVADNIATVAGSDWVGDNGMATSAVLLQAEGIAADPQGNLYLADAAGHRVRKVTRAGIISTVAGTGLPGFSGDGGSARAAQLNSPYGLAFDGRGELYIADLGNARVRRVAVDGTITTIAGGGTIPAGGLNEGKAATSVSLITPRNLAPDGYGNLYVSDFSGHRVYRLSAEGSLTAVAGDGVRGFSGDGAAASLARMAYPAGIALDGHGALFIADSQNHVVRKVAGGVITSVARASTPTGLAFDWFGTLYIADPFSRQILQVPATGPPVALAASAHDLTFAADGYLYAVDGSLARQISFTGPSRIVAGGGSLAYGDHGAATLARLNHPSGVTADSLGNLYIADRDNHRIRRVSPEGTITTVAGTGVAGDSGDGSAAAQAQLSSPSAVTVDAAGNLYIADTGNRRVRQVTPAGLILPVTSTGLVSPTYAVAGGDGNIYIADGGNGTIRKVNASGAITTVLAGLQSPRGLALDTFGSLYFTETSGQRVRRLARSGDLTSLAEGAWRTPCGIAVSETGDVFVADTGLQQILRVDSLGQVSVVAGKGTAGFSGDGGPALAGELNLPWDIAAGLVGRLYIADLNNNRIRVLAAAPANQTLTVANAATLEAGPLAPGMLVVVRGTNLNNVQVQFNGIPALVLAADNTALVVQAPAQIAGLQTVQVEILRNGNVLAQFPAAVVVAAPSLFADASGQASANNEDGTVNSSANPAQRGSVIALYGTGEGVAGLPISVRIGDFPAEVLYAGPVAGYPGLLQINARVPAGYVAPGNLSVTVTVGQVSSQPGVKIAVN